MNEFSKDYIFDKKFYIRPVLLFLCYLIVIFETRQTYYLILALDVFIIQKLLQI